MGVPLTNYGPKKSNNMLLKWPFPINCQGKDLFYQIYLSFRRERKHTNLLETGKEGMLHKSSKF